MTLFVQELINGLTVGATYAVIALGFALTFNVMRVVNLAHPDIVVVALFAGLVASEHQANGVVVVVTAVLVAVAVGLILERLVLRPLRSRSHLITLVATAGVSIFIENVLAGVFGPDPVPFPQLLPSATWVLGSAIVSSGQVLLVSVSVAMMVGVSYYVRRTRLGRATRAVAERPEVAAAFGIDINRVSQVTVALGSVMAGAAGLALGNLYTSAWVFSGQFYSLKAFTCMLVAGNRHIEGIIAVALGLGIAEALITGFISSKYTDAFAFVLLLAVLMFRRSGVFGSYTEYA